MPSPYTLNALYSRGTAFWAIILPKQLKLTENSSFRKERERERAVWEEVRGGSRGLVPNVDVLFATAMQYHWYPLGQILLCAWPWPKINVNLEGNAPHGVPSVHAMQKSVNENVGAAALIPSQ